LDDTQDIKGKLADLFQGATSFILRNMRNIQGVHSFNSLGEPEIDPGVFSELIANALVHRDYFVNAPVRVFIFDDRVEIISPGHLPNNLTVEHIKLGNSCVRNPVIASFASRLLPYRGVGTGIIRALSLYPHIEFFDDRKGNFFKVVVKRPVRK